MKKFLLILILLCSCINILADSILWNVVCDAGHKIYTTSNPFPIRHGETPADRELVDNLPNYNAARVCWMIREGTEYVYKGVVPSAYFNEDTWGYTDLYPDGMGIISEVYGDFGSGNVVKLNEPNQTGEMLSTIEDDGIPNVDKLFYIELGTGYIDENTWEGIWENTVARGELYSYQELEGMYSMGHSNTIMDNVFHMWDGRDYYIIVDIPEPLSSSLIILGLSIILIKRNV